MGETDEFHGGGKSKWGLKPHVYLDSKGAVTHAITKKMSLRWWEKHQKKEIIFKVNITKIIGWFKKRKKRRKNASR